MCSVGWQDDDAPIPSQFSFPDPASVSNAFDANRLDASLWTDAPQGSQRLPVRVTPAPEQRGPARREHVSRDCIEFLRCVVEHPSQYEADDELPVAAASGPESATPPYDTFSMEAVDFTANNQLTAVVSEVVQEEKRRADSGDEIPAKVARFVEERIEAERSRWQEELKNVKRAQQKQSRSLAKTKQTAENAYERTEKNEIELNRCKLCIGGLGAGWKENADNGVLSAKEACCKILKEAVNH